MTAKRRPVELSGQTQGTEQDGPQVCKPRFNTSVSAAGNTATAFACKEVGLRVAQWSGGEKDTGFQPQSTAVCLLQGRGTWETHSAFQAPARGTLTPHPPLLPLHPSTQLPTILQVCEKP